jgi:hypothetical protein
MSAPPYSTAPAMSAPGVPDPAHFKVIGEAGRLVLAEWMFTGEQARAIVAALNAAWARGAASAGALPAQVFVVGSIGDGCGAGEICGQISGVFASRDAADSHAGELGFLVVEEWPVEMGGA